MVRASGSYPFGWEFKSLTAYQYEYPIALQCSASLRDGFEIESFGSVGCLLLGFIPIVAPLPAFALTSTFLSPTAMPA